MNKVLEVLAGIYLGTLIGLGAARLGEIVGEAAYTYVHEGHAERHGKIVKAKAAAAKRAIRLALLHPNTGFVTFHEQEGPGTVN